MRKKTVYQWGLLSLILGLSACSTGKKQWDAANESEGGQYHSQAVGDVTRFYGESVSPSQEAALLNQDTYYFAYDAYELAPEDKLSLYAHAKKLLEGSYRRIRIEGHTDERGSREYNIALGERRAKAVAAILMMKGVKAKQLEILSYGKERPASLGHDESAWQANRRSVIVYEVE